MYDKIIEAVSTIGFPCVMCGALMYYIYSVQVKTQECLSELTEAIVELKGVISHDR